MFALLLEPDRGAETAQALFAAVYDHWTQLTHDRRPELYLHGLSLGALHSDHSFSVYDVLGDPFQGALWSGPPFRSETWRWAIDAWLALTEPAGWTEPEIGRLKALFATRGEPEP